MTEKRDASPAGNAQEQQHVDEDKIGGVAHQNPNWGKEYRIDPDRKAGGGENEDRSGTPKTTPPKRAP
jgi:hypothetical protein